MGLRPVSGAALTSIQHGMEALQRNAAKIAGAARVDRNAVDGLAKPLVEQAGIASRAEASVQALRAEDRLLGALLDVKA
jgi:hypothetical protein